LIDQDACVVWASRVISMQQRKLVGSGATPMRTSCRFAAATCERVRKYPRKKGEIFQSGETSYCPRKLSTINSRQVETMSDTWRLLALSKCNATCTCFLRSCIPARHRQALNDPVKTSSGRSDVTSYSSSRSICIIE